MSQAATLIPESIPSPATESDKHYEIVNGQRVEKPPMGNIQAWVASILVERLGHHSRTHGLGRVVSEMLFKINPTGDPMRRPDVAYFSYERWPRARKISSENGLDVVPDLAIEVNSPSNTADDVLGKVREYFQAGVLRVWVVYPSVRQVHIFESVTKVEILEVGDDLDGGDLLPGFRLSVAELFEDGAEG